MRTREQVIWDFVQEWLAKAGRDLRAAEILLADPEDFCEYVAFHCQQAVEKFQKAFLVRHQIEFSKTHDLAQIRTLISQVDASLAERLAPADWLTPFGVETRYPGYLREVTRETAQRALHDAQAVRMLVHDSLGSYLSAGRPD